MNLSPTNFFNEGFEPSGRCMRALDRLILQNLAGQERFETPNIRFGTAYGVHATSDPLFGTRSVN